MSSINPDNYKGNYQGLYNARLEQGWAYQDFIARELAPHGIILNNLQSRDAQREYGENLFGLEIKYDGKFEQSNCVWIEIEEKSNSAQRDYRPSGVLRVDHSWLFGIGDRREFFIFSKRTLRHLIPSRRILENGTKTSRGFLLHRDEIPELTEKCIPFYPSLIAPPGWP